MVQGDCILMIEFHAHFDGKSIVPEEAIDLPRDRSFVVHVESFSSADMPVKESPQSALQWLAENAVEDEMPVDLAAQHDHYLYGTPRRD
jgi:hypothetical protein